MRPHACITRQLKIDDISLYHCIAIRSLSRQVRDARPTQHSYTPSHMKDNLFRLPTRFEHWGWTQVSFTIPTKIKYNYEVVLPS